MPLATETDRSGTITTGGTAQDVYAAGLVKNSVFFQNVSDTDMRIEFGGNASSTAGRLIPANGGAYETPASHVPAGKLSVYCATTGKRFICKTT